MHDGYLNIFLNNGEIVVSDIADDRGIHERVIHQQQKIVQYKTKTLIYSLEENDIPPEMQNKTPWIKKKTASQLKNWSGSESSGLAFFHQTNKWVTLGILIQVNEFTDRGINLKNTYYVPGFNLLNYWKTQARENEEQNKKFIKAFTEILNNLTNPYGHVGFEILRQWLLKQVNEREIAIKRIDFFLSVLITASKAPFFDWKEIGTNSYFKEKVHAASKMFDGNMVALLEELEEIIGDPVSSIHLTTRPGNRDIILAVQCRLAFTFGMYNYEKAPVLSKVTDEEVHDLQSIDAKNIRTIFAAENRAVVRKLIKHIPYEQRAHIGIVGFDGQVRSAVYDLLRHFKNAGVGQIIIWSDYDRAAIAMVEKLYALGFEQFKFVAKKQGTLFLVSYAEGLKQLKELTGTNHLTEQEDFLWDFDLLEAIVLEGNAND
ncbi:DUF2399 domain-containing protein [Desulfoscipio sp. XC116]|uniref:DUF2399 domain-containing protein n=1 Tax=Desulfoscipio sp. XC116 TaxID=3144975 RepID=UPI00325C1BA0